MNESAPSYPVELGAPDVEPYRKGNVGPSHVLRFSSGREGPHLLITALVHGNEICGAIALDWLLRQGVRPRRGTLTLAFCNLAAFARFDPTAPNESRYVDEDFNRVWSPERLDGEASSVELRRARELRPVVDAADMLLDLHSMQHPCPPLIMAGPLAKGVRFAAEIGAPPLVVSDAGHAAGARMRDYGGFGDPGSPKNAMLVECGQHWAASSAEIAKECVVRFLARFEAVEPAWAARHLPTEPPPPQRRIEVTHPVTIATDAFRFTAPWRGLETIARAGSIIGHDGEQPVVTPYDDCVLIMPSRRLAKGQTAVRLGRYVD